MTDPIDKIPVEARAETWNFNFKINRATGWIAMTITDSLGRKAAYEFPQDVVDRLRDRLDVVLRNADTWRRIRKMLPLKGAKDRGMHN